MPFSVQAEMTAMVEAMVWLLTAISAVTVAMLALCLLGLAVEGLRETLRRSVPVLPAQRRATEIPSRAMTAARS